jgi:hypothetical protein
VGIIHPAVKRVVIARLVFSDNNTTKGGDGSVTGIVMLAYSLTITDCLFKRNAARLMVFVYNNNAMVYSTMFAKNAVEVSTVIMSSPGESDEAAAVAGTAAGMASTGSRQDKG